MSKILMVDDDNDFLEACKPILAKEGHEIKAANTVEEAEKSIKAFNPDLILLDIMMKAQDDGIALAQKLRKEGNKTPIIMLSGVSKVTGYNFGKCDNILPCNDFLEKPVTPDALLKKVKEILGK